MKLSSSFIFLLMVINCSSIICWKGYLSSTKINFALLSKISVRTQSDDTCLKSWLFWRLWQAGELEVSLVHIMTVGHICVGLVLGSLFCFIDLCICPSTVLIVETIQFFKAGRLIPPTSFFFFKIDLAVLVLLSFYLNCGIISFISIELLLDFYRNFIKPVYQFGENCPL
jgi:hypothetical protein